MNTIDKAILCIDDERIILDSLKAQLRGELGNEFNIEIAENASEGFEVIEEMMEDQIKLLIIVSDWMMPGMKGDEFLSKVHQSYPKIIKILLTGQADEDAIERVYREANLYKVINKPWQKKDLIETLKSGLEKQMN